MKKFIGKGNIFKQGTSSVSLLDTQTPCIEPMNNSQVALVHPKNSPISLSQRFTALELIKDDTSSSKS